MSVGRRALSATALAAMLSSSGCASLFRPKKVSGEGPGSRAWSGRISVQVDSQPPQAFAGAFELTGDAASGELTLFTPIGSTVAHLQWQPGKATLRDAADRTRKYASLDELAANVLGTPVPFAALFQWLAGNDAPASGWQADLGQLASGRITARRVEPGLPAAQLRVVLDR